MAAGALQRPRPFTSPPATLNMNSPDPIEMMPQWMAGQVTRVADGDTLTIQATLGLGIEQRAAPVRLLGIQAPELRGDDRYNAYEARRQLTALTQTRYVYLHVPGDRCDRYGRWLGLVWIRRKRWLLSANRWMVEEGNAWEWWPTGWGYALTLPPLWVPMPRLDLLSERD